MIPEDRSFSGVSENVEGVDEPDLENYSLDRPSTSAKLNIIADDEENNIAITVARNAQADLQREVPERRAINHSLVPDKISEKERRALVSIERNDPINQEEEPESVKDINDIIDKYLTNKSCINLLQRHKVTKKELNKLLRANIKDTESRTVDPFEGWLGERKESPFDYLKDMTLEDIEDLISRSDTRKIITLEDIKYETFLDWTDKIPEMMETVVSDKDMTFGELYVEWVVRKFLSENEAELEI